MNETTTQLMAHIEALCCRHRLLTGFSPNTVVICHEHLATLLAAPVDAVFDGNDHRICGMLVIENRYAVMPRLMFEYRPVR